MPKSLPKRISLTRKQRAILEQIVRRRNSSQGLAYRAAVILFWAEGRTITQTATDRAITRDTVYQWRERWWEAVTAWTDHQKAWSYAQLREKVHSLLTDHPRSGAPMTFTPEECCQIIALACKKPSDCGVPISHWSASDLTREVLKQGLVSAISPRTVGRLLKKRTSNRISCGIG